MNIQWPQVGLEPGDKINGGFSLTVFFLYHATLPKKTTSFRTKTWQTPGVFRVVVSANKCFQSTLFNIFIMLLTGGPRVEHLVTFWATGLKRGAAISKS